MTMAMFIGIIKVREDDESAWYEFGRTEEPSSTGMLRITKADGEVTLVKELPNDPESRVYRRAARKVSIAWREGRYPDKTCWAS
jgi:hypothetical protein